jgi:hypothetical protein
MAVSQDWSDRIAGWFEGEGKILQIIRIAGMHM